MTQSVPTGRGSYVCWAPEESGGRRQPGHSSCALGGLPRRRAKGAEQGGLSPRRRWPPCPAPRITTRLSAFIYDPDSACPTPLPRSGKKRRQPCPYRTALCTYPYFGVTEPAAGARKSVGWGKSVAVRVVLGGRRCIKKKTK